MAQRNTQTTRTSGVVDRVRKTKPVRTLQRRGYLTAEIIVMWVAYVAMMVCTVAFEWGMLGGVTSGMVSDQVFTWFTPAGYVFGIWTIIYIALAFWLVFYTKDAAVSSDGSSGFIAVLFVASCILNVLWLGVWHFARVGIAFVVIVALWAVLVGLYVLVRRTPTRMVDWVPISLYTAWLTVATIANLTQLITRALDGGIPILNDLSAILISAGVLVLGYVMYKTYGDWMFPLVILWAVVGVGAHVSEVSGFSAAIIFLLAVAGGILTFANQRTLRLIKR